ncbi:Flagellar FlbT family protein [Magnetospirillum molischianum]|uniref:Flagellar FlbT family protein n=1 Tax=Magnetospirillum molischianum DSM 120 TaxID=1150626 RepID=H8FRP4_MAGML|nr:Flagellar FlbT family protein [Magnetospirillum molischianum]CCG41032.1 Flagellar FlbT family protein [Magnetospirillum molischianum DSM 120]
MSLKINLAQGESILIGKAKVQNGGSGRCVLIVSGSENVLREKRIMREKDAITPVRRLYFLTQSIYLADDKPVLFDLYHQIAREAVAAWPILTGPITDIGELILVERYYDALMACHGLVDIERELMGETAEETQK